MRTRGAVRTFALGAILVLVGAAATEASVRIPVSSADDATASLANRVMAVANVFPALQGRLERIDAALPSDSVLPADPMFGPLGAIVAGSDAIFVSLENVCFGPIDGVVSRGGAGPSIADGDGLAADGSTLGLVGQAEAIVTVLAQANARLERIQPTYSIQPGDPMQFAIAAAWDGAGGLWLEANVMLDPGFGVSWPPNPCAPLDP